MKTHSTAFAIGVDNSSKVLVLVVVVVLVVVLVVVVVSVVFYVFFMSDNVDSWSQYKKM